MTARGRVRCSVAVVIVWAAMLLAMAAACSLPPGPTSAPSSVAPSEPPLGGVQVLAKPWLPPWAGPGAPPEIAERAAHRFCGVEQAPGPANRDVRACFLDSVAAGFDIEFATVGSTKEGDPIATVYGFEEGPAIR